MINIGIYKIVCKVNNKMYIGQSTNIKSRWKQHIGMLNGNYHINIHLQSAWNKYGEDNFIFEIIEECSIDKLNEREVYWIEKYNSFKNGFNRTIGGDDSNKRKVICLNNAKVYNSLVEVELIYNVSNSNLSKACSGERRSCGKDKDGVPLIWRYYDENMRIDYSKEELFRMSRPILKKTYFDKIICLNTGKIYSSTSEAEREYGISNICKCLIKEYKSCGYKDGQKLRWMRYCDFLESNKTKEQILSEIISTEISTTKVVSILEELKIFDSVISCANYYGIKYQNIVAICLNNGKRNISIKDKNGKRQSFVYYDDFIKYNKSEFNEYIESIKKRIYKKIICLETKKVYNSIKEVSNDYNMSSGYISKICRNGDSFEGFHFSYI